MAEVIVLSDDDFSPPKKNKTAVASQASRSKSHHTKHSAGTSKKSLETKVDGDITKYLTKTSKTHRRISSAVQDDSAEVLNGKEANSRVKRSLLKHLNASERRDRDGNGRSGHATDSAHQNSHSNGSSEDRHSDDHHRRFRDTETAGESCSRPKEHRAARVMFATEGQRVSRNIEVHRSNKIRDQKHEHHQSSRSPEKLHQSKIESPTRFSHHTNRSSGSSEKRHWKAESVSGSDMKGETKSPDKSRSEPGRNSDHKHRSESGKRKDSPDKRHKSDSSESQKDQSPRKHEAPHDKGNCSPSSSSRSHGSCRKGEADAKNKEDKSSDRKSHSNCPQSDSKRKEGSNDSRSDVAERKRDHSAGSHSRSKSKKDLTSSSEKERKPRSDGGSSSANKPKGDKGSPERFCPQSADSSCKKDEKANKPTVQDHTTESNHSTNSESSAKSNRKHSERLVHSPHRAPPVIDLATPPPKKRLIEDDGSPSGKRAKLESSSGCDMFTIASVEGSGDTPDSSTADFSETQMAPEVKAGGVSPKKTGDRREYFVKSESEVPTPRKISGDDETFVGTSPTPKKPIGKDKDQMKPVVFPKIALGEEKTRGKSTDDNSTKTIKYVDMDDEQSVYMVALKKKAGRTDDSGGNSSSVLDIPDCVNMAEGPTGDHLEALCVVLEPLLSADEERILKKLRRRHAAVQVLCAASAARREHLRGVTQQCAERMRTEPHRCFTVLRTFFEQLDQMKLVASSARSRPAVAVQESDKEAAKSGAASSAVKHSDNVVAKRSDKPTGRRSQPTSTNTSTKASSSDKPNKPDLVADSNAPSTIAGDPSVKTVDSETARRRHRRHVTKLERTLRRLEREITHHEAQEVDWDDDVGSAYMVGARLKRRYVQVYEYYCKIVGAEEEATKLAPRRIRFDATQFPSINRRVEKFVNRTREFPDFKDVYDLIKTANIKDGLRMGHTAVQDQAKAVFAKLGEQLQRRRRAALAESMDAMSGADDWRRLDPADQDTNLHETLAGNAQRAQAQLSKVFQHFSEKQDLALAERRKKRQGEEDDGKREEEEDQEPEDDQDEDEEDSEVTDDEEVDLSEVVPALHVSDDVEAHSGDEHVVMEEVLALNGEDGDMDDQGAQTVGEGGPSEVKVNGCSENDAIGVIGQENEPSIVHA